MDLQLSSQRFIRSDTGGPTVRSDFALHPEREESVRQMGKEKRDRERERETWGKRETDKQRKRCL